MRKGLVTLGVVALVLAVSPSFAEAPLLTCLPDIVISDVEQNSATADANLFVFSDAINFDEYVVDPDTPVDTLRWSFIESGGATIEINGIPSNPLVNTVEPGADDLRAVAATASFVDVEWTATPPATAGETKEVFIDMHVSDGTAVSTQTIKVTSVNDTDATGAPDAVVPVEVASFDFATGAEGWTQFTASGVINATLAASGGSLNATEPAIHINIVYGAWESPKNPATGVHAKIGCIHRARYQVSTNAASATATPGFRFRALAKPMIDVGGGVWDPDFTDDNYNVTDAIIYSSANLIMGMGGLDARMPGAGSEYTLMAFPRQVAEQLMDPNVVLYFTADLMDLDATFDTDSGTLSFESVTIDGVDRPEPGAGTAVPALTFATADFATGWTASTKALPPGTFISTGLSASATASGLEITVGTSSENFEAFAELNTGVSLEAGRVYRLMFMATSTETPGGDAGPLLRTNVTSSRFVYSAIKELEGGALLARLTSTPSPMELWILAPTEDTNVGGGLTEPMKPQIQSYLTANVAQFPFFREVSGTVAITEINTEVFDLVNGRLE
jgi:hypothetical protein